MTLGPAGRAMLYKLGERFAPVALSVRDDSHRHAGHMGARPEGETHFSVGVASEAFAGKRLVERHRMVNALLAGELGDGVHALAISAQPADGIAFSAVAADDGRLLALLDMAKLPADDIAGAARRYWALLRGERMLACGGLETHGASGLMRSIAAAEPGRGHGAAMTARLLGEAREAGIGELWLLTETAQGFFADFGFEECPRALVPFAIASTSQFTGTRCAGATAMRRART